MLQHENIIAAICRMPLDYRSGGGKSMVALYQESGCAAALASISADPLADYLREHPQVIQGWLLDSVDRRTGSGPYLEEPDDDGSPWILGQYPAGTREEYPDGPTACAAFILLRLEELAGTDPRAR